MKTLKEITKCKNVGEALELLLTFDNALDYNELSASLYKEYPNTTIRIRLANYFQHYNATDLPNEDYAAIILFCQGHDMFDRFKHIVAKCNNDAIPYIVKAIHLNRLYCNY